MEEKRENAHQPQQLREENPSEAQYFQEDKSTRPMEQKGGRDGEGIIVENQVPKAAKVGEGQIELAKKPKQGSKQSLKAKPTVPEPFTLSTEKRMSKERRGSIDFSSENLRRKPKERHGSMDFRNSYPQPKLSRSVSLSHKDRSSPNARETSNLNGAKSLHGTLKTSSKPQVTAAEHVQNGIGNAQKTKDRTLPKGTESKHLEGNDKKQQVEGIESSNLQKSTTFKALPLPRFYQKKDSPPQSENKKKPEINSKSPSFGQQNFPRPISKAGRNKIEDKGRGSSKTITNRAKETIRKVLNTSKVTTKGIVTSA